MTYTVNNMKDRFHVFSKNLKIERIEKGYTQKKMAELLGTTQPVYNRYERGGTAHGREPDFDTLYKISKILDVSIDYLFETDN